MKRKLWSVLLLVLLITISGCGNQAASLTESTVSENVAESGIDSDQVADTVSTAEGLLNDTEMFTDRDKEIGYDESQSVSIVLNGQSAVADSDSVKITENKITIMDKGTYILTGTLEDGTVLIDAEDSDKVQLVLNNVSISSSDFAAIYVKQADKVFITLGNGTKNSLANGGEYISLDDNNVDAVVFSKSDLTLNGQGSLTIDAIAGHGIVSKDDLVITSGNYQITSAGHGLSGKDSIRIADGEFTIEAGEDGLHAENGDDDTKGFVYVEDGNFQITAVDDGIHANQAINILAGNISIIESYEGIEGLMITISGGDITVKASDDGLNAAGGNDQSGFGGMGNKDAFASDSAAGILIEGGVLKMDAAGDGMDSNGSLSVTGGEVYISGPVDNDNGALDYNTEGTLSGGILVAAGASGMAQNFSTAENQGVMLVSCESQPAGTVISVTDSTGKELLSWEAQKSFSSVVISCPEILEGETYTVTTGSESTTVTMDSLVYGASNGMGGPGGFGGGMGPGLDSDRNPGMGPGPEFDRNNSDQDRVESTESTPE